MTCVYDTIIKKLKTIDLVKITNQQNPSPKLLMTNIKNLNQFTINCLHQNKQLSLKEIKENYTRIYNIDINKLNDGYLVSGCEPLFLLLVYIFNIKIIHNYNGINIEYKPKYNKIRYSITLNSSTSHMF